MNDEIVRDEDAISHKSLFRCFLQTDLWWFLLDLFKWTIDVMINWTCLELHVLNGQLRANQTGVMLHESLMLENIDYSSIYSLSE